MEKQIKNRFEKIEGRVEKIEKTLFDEGLSKKGNLLRCNCGYSWISKTKKKLVSCPNCGNKVKARKEELVTCFKCKKKIKKKDAKYGYNNYFCKGCFKKYDKEAKKEVDKMMRNAEKKGII